jgi:hypothetical protein
MPEFYSAVAIQYSIEKVVLSWGLRVDSLPCTILGSAAKCLKECIDLRLNR